MGQSRTKLTLGAAAATAALAAVPVALVASSQAAGRPGAVGATAIGGPVPTGTFTATAPTGTATTTGATPAGTVGVDAACYVDLESTVARVVISGANWSPGDTIELTDSLQHISATVTAGSDGTFTATVPAPSVPDHDTVVSDRIQAVDEGSEGATSPNGASVQSAPFLTTRYQVTRTSERGDAAGKATFALSGFAAGRPVYVHYLSHTGRLLASTALGRPSGACGLRRVVAAESPGTTPQPGDYVLQFDDARHYSARTAPQYRLHVTVPQR